MSLFPSVDALFILGILASIVAIIARHNRYRLPPGPRGLPFIGNAHQIPNNFEWIQYRQWSRKCGSDIISLSIFGQRVIVLNSARAVNDLLEKRSVQYSNKEQRHVFQELLGWRRAFPFMAYGDEWRDHHRLFHQYFNSNAVKNYHDILVNQSKRLLVLLNQGDNVMGALRMSTGSTILRITFGIDVRSADDPFVQIAEQALQSQAKFGNTGSCLAEYIPILQYLPAWVPGSGFKRDVAFWKPYVAEMYERPFRQMQNAIAEGTAVPCVLNTILTKREDGKSSALTDGVIQGVTGTAFVAGSDTTVSSLGTFILAMMLHPDVQRRAQKELDEVVGQDRLPNFDDAPSLPFIEAIVKEVIRWRPVTPLATPHYLDTDDNYMGYDIPGGSVVLGNAWAVLFDEEHYPNPEVFDPTRYLTPDGKPNKDAPNPYEVAFGFGRRICPGRHLALENVWINAAYILATMNIEKTKDEHGNIIEPSGEYTSGLLSYPVPFKANISPRTANAASIVHAIGLEAEVVT